LPLYERERAAGRAIALAVVVHTSGSTYRKPGALMAIAGDGTYAGLLSGGCLETDLGEHALAVIETGKAHLVTYNTGGSDDDLLWGLGVGCEGAMRILLLRSGPAEDWQPLDYLGRSLASHARAAVGVVVESIGHEISSGRVLLPDRLIGLPEHLRAELSVQLARAAQSARTGWLESDGLRIFAVPLALPPRLLLLGAGPDALPIVDLAARLAWKTTVFDHRPAYAQAKHFAGAERVVLGRAEELARNVELASFDAAVIMSHHLPSDLAYLRVMSASQVGYVGLLGPPARRERLLSDLGSEATAALDGRLRAPVGLDLGGRAPESIALSIVAEIHAHLAGREGGHFRGAVAPGR
jgi:xanthine/CO dehydrogenase XdhC/CoxF family maturation factor